MAELGSAECKHRRQSQLLVEAEPTLHLLTDDCLLVLLLILLFVLVLLPVLVLLTDDYLLVLNFGLVGVKSPKLVFANTIQCLYGIFDQSKHIIFQ